MEWGNASASPAAPKQGRSQQEQGWKRKPPDVSTPCTFPWTQHIFVCGALSPAEGSLPAGAKLVPKLLCLTVEVAFVRKGNSSSTEGTTAKLRQPHQVKSLTDSTSLLSR